MEVKLHILLISTKQGSEFSDSGPNRSISSDGAAGDHWIVIGRPQGQYGRYREVNNISPFPGIEPRFLSFLAHTLLVNRTEVNLQNKKIIVMAAGQTQCCRNTNSNVRMDNPQTIRQPVLKICNKIEWSKPIDVSSQVAVLYL